MNDTKKLQHIFKELLKARLNSLTKRDIFDCVTLERIYLRRAYPNEVREGFKSLRPEKLTRVRQGHQSPYASVRRGQQEPQFYGEVFSCRSSES